MLKSAVFAHKAILKAEARVACLNFNDMDLLRGPWQMMLNLAAGFIVSCPVELRDKDSAGMRKKEVKQSPRRH